MTDEEKIARSIERLKSEGKMIKVDALDENILTGAAMIHVQYGCGSGAVAAAMVMLAHLVVHSGFDPRTVMASALHSTEQLEKLYAKNGDALEEFMQNILPPEHRDTKPRRKYDA